MTILYFVLPFAVWSLCALHDLTSFKIPNRYVAVLAVGFLPAAFLAGLPLSLLAASAAFAAIMLVAGFALFATGTLGAGDAKLIAASALWIGPAAAAPFVLYTTLVGAALGLILLQARKAPLPAGLARFGWVRGLHARERVMPYGVAIAAGGMMAMPQSVFAG